MADEGYYDQEYYDETGDQAVEVYGYDGGYEEEAYQEEGDYGDHDYVDENYDGQEYAEEPYDDVEKPLANYEGYEEEEYVEEEPYAEHYEEEGNNEGYPQAIDDGVYPDKAKALEQQDFYQDNTDKLSNKDPLPEGWVSMYDESMEAYYYLHEESGEASWVRPVIAQEVEEAESFPSKPAPKRFGGDIKPYDYDAMTRTWNPNAMSTSGTAFATLRPRVTPVVTLSLKPDAVHQLKGTKEIYALSEAEQEEKRLRVFDRHLRIKGKSKLEVKRKEAVSALPTPFGATRITTPEKRAEIRGIIAGDLSKARNLLETTKKSQEIRSQLKSSKSKGVAFSAAAVTGKGLADGDAWRSTNWPVGPKGFAHPPAHGDVGDFDTLGERALVEAWRRRRPPPPAGPTRFALGVPEAVVVDAAPSPPSPRRQKYSDLMDHFALLTLHYHCGGLNWTQRSGWDDSLHGKRPPGSHMAWFGVHTYSTLVQRVVNLVMPKNNLVGPLVPELGWLDELKILSLPQNNLSGCIPQAWSTMTSLLTLDLSDNQITGPLPARFFDGMKRNRDIRDRGNGLKSLNLSNNKMWGEIPYTVSTLVGLTTLNLSNNTMSQKLPEGLMRCISLRSLRLHDNKFTGSIPPEISQLSQLMILDISQNLLEGEIPSLPKKLTKIHLQNNRLTRDIPNSFFKLINVADVNLSNNYLSGSVSDDVVNLKRLRILRLDGNRHSLADKAVITDCLSAYLPALIRQQGFKI